VCVCVCVLRIESVTVRGSTRHSRRQFIMCGVIRTGTCSTALNNASVCRRTNTLHCQSMSRDNETTRECLKPCVADVVRVLMGREDAANVQVASSSFDATKNRRTHHRLKVLIDE